MNWMNFPGSHVHASVSGSTYTLILLAYIHDVVAILHQTVHGAHLRTVVNHDNLALEGTQREGKDAVDTLTQQLYGLVVVSDDKTDQWSIFLFNHGAKIRNYSQFRNKIRDFAFYF